MGQTATARRGLAVPAIRLALTAILGQIALILLSAV